MAIDWHGCTPLPRTRLRLRRRIRWVLSRHPHLYITATTGGTHAAGSYHYLGRAVDFGSNDPNNGPEKKAYLDLHRKFGNHFTELFGPEPFYVKDGRRYRGQFPGHGDHIHMAL